MEHHRLSITFTSSLFCNDIIGQSLYLGRFGVVSEVSLVESLSFTRHACILSHIGTAYSALLTYHTLLAISLPAMHFPLMLFLNWLLFLIFAFTLKPRSSGLAFNRTWGGVLQLLPRLKGLSVSIDHVPQPINVCFSS